MFVICHVMFIFDVKFIFDVMFTFACSLFVQDQSLKETDKLNHIQLLSIISCQHCLCLSLILVRVLGKCSTVMMTSFSRVMWLNSIPLLCMDSEPSSYIIMCGL